MKNFIVSILIFVIAASCAQEKTTFDKVALEELFMNTNGQEVSFKDILAKHKGKTIFIDVWASWCHDCVGSIPDLKKLQAQEKELVYLMLSVDKNADAWKNGIKKHDLIGEHYLITKGWKGKTPSEFCTYINLDWIPRYMIVGKDGSIKLYKAIELKDKQISEVITLEKK